jgi:hypothetical protein
LLASLIFFTRKEPPKENKQLKFNLYLFRRKEPPLKSEPPPATGERPASWTKFLRAAPWVRPVGNREAKIYPKEKTAYAETVFSSELTF